MTTDQTVTEIFRVGKRTCTLTIGEAGSTAEWEPTKPTRLNKKEMKQYRSGRHAAIEKLADIMGGQVVCVDV